MWQTSKEPEAQSPAGGIVCFHHSFCIPEINWFCFGGNFPPWDCGSHKRIVVKGLIRSKLLDMFHVCMTFENPLLSFFRLSALTVRIWKDSIFCHLHSLIVQMWIWQNKLIIWTFSMWDSKLGLLRPGLCFVDMQSPRILCSERVWVILLCGLFLARNFVYQKSWLGN